MRVGFVGLGAMGAGIVPRLLNAGHRVTGWNRSPEKAAALLKAGMTWAETPRAVAGQSEIVFSIVTDAPAVRAVALGKDGILSGLGADGIYLDMSTIAPDASRAVCSEFAKAGRTMLDHTVILWISEEATPAYGRHPWTAILLGGSALGVPGGRYLRVPQDVVTAEPFTTGTTLLGASHNHLLVTLSRWFGRDTNSVGLTTLPQARGAPTLDLRGPLPGL